MLAFFEVFMNGKLHQRRGQNADVITKFYIYKSKALGTVRLNPRAFYFSKTEN